MDIDHGLLAWIKKQAESGFSKNDVRQAMLRSGYAKKHVAMVDDVYSPGMRKVRKAAALIAIAAIIAAIAFFAVRLLPGSEAARTVTLSSESNSGSGLAEALLDGKTGIGTEILGSIKPEHLPRKAAVTELEQNGVTRRAEWNTTGARFSAEASLQGGAAESASIGIILASAEEITSAKTASLLASYFNIDKRSYSCYRKQRTSLLICDYFSQEEKKGSGALYNANSGTVLLYQCELSKKTDRTSCLS